jgi:4'-phosphopantetheinyl transferase
VPDLLTPAVPASVEVFTVLTEGVPDQVVDALIPLLTPDELARRTRFLREVDRRTFVITRALVRRTLSTYGPTAPRDWRFETNAHGCPSVAGPQAGTPPLAFNLSHTNGLVALAVTRGHLVGVDVERVDRVVRERIAERYFAPSEVRDLHALAADAQPRAFFEYWTLKEAYIKARGMGLAIPLGDFAFALRPPAPPTIAFVDGFDDRPERWRFWQAWPTAHHRLALAVACDGAGLTVAHSATTADALVP